MGENSKRNESHIAFYSFQNSFAKSSIGFQARRICGVKNSLWLDYAFWEVGLLAYQFLINRFNTELSLAKEIQSHALQHLFPRICEKWSDQIDSEFLPEFLDLIRAGKVHLEDKEPAEFEGAWPQLTISAKILIMFDLAFRRGLDPFENDEGLTKTLASLAVLSLIDEATMYAMSGDSDLVAACSAELHRIRYVLDPDDPMRLAVEKARANVLKSRAGQGGTAKGKRSEVARHFVTSEWDKHKTEYKQNKSAFARDYVRRVLREYEIQVTEKTIREVWLKPPDC